MVLFTKGLDVFAWNDNHRLLFSITDTKVVNAADRTPATAPSKIQIHVSERAVYLSLFFLIPSRANARSSRYTQLFRGMIVASGNCELIIHL